MKIIKLALVLVLVFALSSQALASTASQSINTFAFNAAKLIGQDSHSWFFSPYSIISAFGMVYAGASGETAKEIEQVLGFSPEIHASLNELDGRLADSKLITSANRVWLCTGLKLRESYKHLLALNYGATPKELDIKNDPEYSCKTINDWVSRKTNGRIQDLLRQLDPETQMILTNAVYFNAMWQFPFAKYKTTKKPFHDGERITDVDMMIQDREFRYGEFDGVKVIMLPYEGRTISMLAVLPPEGGNLENLNAETLIEWVKALKTHEVDLWLPKFRTEGRYELADMFKALGVRLAFSDDANFSGITRGEKLKVDAVIHQSFIDVDEEKTEAAAATAIGMVGATAMPMPKPIAEFHADHPFTYFIMDNQSGTILFMGYQTF